jgi:uncharacterized membrane protein
MAILETSVKISKPVTQVFEFITNLENQKKLSSYITGIQVSEPLKVGTRYKVQTTSMGHVIETLNEVVDFEPNKKFGVKTFASPPALDVTNTYVVEEDSGGTKLKRICKPSCRKIRWEGFLLQNAAQNLL